ncbi:hypothetical protein NL425_27575, partial [Klebsiella pneumoniae]|nr:hypothetical protein [Klebsiella pneumoniae]
VAGAVEFELVAPALGAAVAFDRGASDRGAALVTGAGGLRLAFGLGFGFSTGSGGGGSFTVSTGRGGGSKASASGGGGGK